MDQSHSVGGAIRPEAALREGRRSAKSKPVGIIQYGVKKFQ